MSDMGTEPTGQPSKKPSPPANFDKTGGDKILAAKPSELILIALEDIKKVERSKIYKIDMSTWHTIRHEYETGEDNEEPRKEPRKVCYVCEGGAVMAMTLKMNFDEELGPDDIHNGEEVKKIRSRIEALDNARCGNMRAYLKPFGIPKEHPIWVDMEDKYDEKTSQWTYSWWTQQKLPHYSDDPKTFKKVQRQFVKRLQQFDL